MDSALIFTSESTSTTTTKDLDIAPQAKPQPESDQAPTAARRLRVSDSTRSRLNRQGRALCRLLYAEGRSITEISGIIEGSPMTVAKVIHNSYKDKDDPADDYSFVDEEFIIKYKIKRPSSAPTADNVTQVHRGEEVTRNPEESQPSASISTRHVNGVIDVPPLPRRRQLTSSSSSSDHTTNVTSGSSLANRSRRYAVPARFCPITQERRVSAVSRRDDPVDSDRACDGLHDFLSSLNFDLTKWYPEMKRKGLATEEDLLAISGWGEESLDRVFKKMLPNVPELHIYVLTEGVMAYAKNIGQ